jgi:DNA-binding transcriptional LysR family regulator
VELRHIRHFIAICEHGGFSRAALACGISQPALTKSIKALEEQVGGAVFHREGRRLVLSELGRRVQPHFVRLLEEQNAALTAARDFRLLRQSPLRVGVLPTIGPARVGSFLTVFRDGNPGVEVAISEGAAETLARQLQSAELDMALGNPAGGFDDSLRSTPVYQERYMVVLPPGHPLASKDPIVLADLDGQDYVDRLACEMRESLTKLLGERSIRLYARFRSEREDWIQSMVLAGLGFAFLPEHSVTMAQLPCRRLADPALVREVHAFEVRGRERTPAAARFLRQLIAIPGQFRQPGP